MEECMATLTNAEALSALGALEVTAAQLDALGGLLAEESA
jgi:hypothetical protein